ncbi:predicted protein [Naegleria gruberi]|uniref:Predicted protein n=1 Tax=Naegleria gruberi TaxID=5762 RepID=D2W6F1_NAEGR|nr:uncharacterized protein NAEGRDRAFT_54959 [Naegleria gruberi]EFC35351.1 predicted protein [Naegleria gruberi]|eukprot:XP_002668095.1 predicted protein [Naegleria gruberi strain NEG-M]
MKIFSKHYQSEIEKQGTSSFVGSESKTFETDGRTYEEDNSDLDEEYYSDYSYDIPPHQNVVVEQWNTKIYDNLGVTDFSDDEYEEGLDFKQLGHIFKNLENEANNPLKRKRFDPLTFEDYSQNFIENRLKNTIASFESNTWDYDLKQEFEGELTENIPAIKILAREGVKKRKLENQSTEPSENDLADNDILTTRYDSCIMEKKPVNRTIDEASSDYFLYDSFQLPNAKMLLQQAAENFSSQLFKYSNSYAQLCRGTCATEEGDLIRTRSVLFSTLLFRHELQWINLNFRAQFESILQEYVDTTRLQNEVLESINRFEYIETNEDEDDEFIDNISSCSSDSMVSNACQLKMILKSNEETIFADNTCISCKTLADYKEMNPELICTTGDGFPTIIESHQSYDYEIKFTESREEAIHWMNGKLFN